jgi:hypothetical protein
MKFLLSLTRRSMVFSLLFLALLFGPSAATDQPLADSVVGYWVSSSGAELTISYSGDPQKAWLSINGGANIDLWLAGGARGGLTVDYTTADGDAITGTLQSDGTLVVGNKSGSFKSVWKRR